MNDDVDYTKAMFGENAIHIPFNATIQQSGKHNDTYVFSIIGQTSCVSPVSPVMFGGTKTHQLILGDCIIRPHLVIETNDMQGRGISGLARTGMDEWVRSNHNILLDPMGKASKLRA